MTECTKDREYIETLEKYMKICHVTLTQLIDSNKVSPAMYIDLGNGCKSTIGNIKAELPIKRF